MSPSQEFECYLPYINTPCSGGIPPPPSNSICLVRSPIHPVELLRITTTPSPRAIALSRLPLLVVLSFVPTAPLLAADLHLVSLFPALGVPHVCLSWVFCNNPQRSFILDSAKRPNRRLGSHHRHGCTRSGPQSLSTNTSQLGRLSPKTMDGPWDTTLVHRNRAQEMVDDFKKWKAAGREKIG